MARQTVEQKISAAISANNAEMLKAMREMLGGATAPAAPAPAAPAPAAPAPAAPAPAAPAPAAPAPVELTDAQRAAFVALVGSNDNLRLKSREFLIAIGWLIVDNGNEDEAKAAMQFSEEKPALAIGRFGAAYYPDFWDWKGRDENRKPKGPRSQKSDRDEGGKIPFPELDALIRAEQVARSLRSLYSRDENRENTAKPGKLEIAQKAVEQVLTDGNCLLCEYLNSNGPEERERRKNILLYWFNVRIFKPDAFINRDWLALNFSDYEPDGFNRKNAETRQVERASAAGEAMTEEIKKRAKK